MLLLPSHTPLCLCLSCCHLCNLRASLPSPALPLGCATAFACAAGLTCPDLACAAFVAIRGLASLTTLRIYTTFPNTKNTILRKMRSVQSWARAFFKASRSWGKLFVLALSRSFFGLKFRAFAFALPRSSIFRTFFRAPRFFALFFALLNF